MKNTTRWTEWLRTSVGVRFDGFRFDVRKSNLSANAHETYDGLVSPKIGIVLGPWYDTEFYLNGGLGYHSNDARGANITIDPIIMSQVIRTTMVAFFKAMITTSTLLSRSVSGSDVRLSFKLF